VEERFIDLYNKYGDAVFRYCILRIADRETALDITQESFTKLWDEIAKGKIVENSRAFLFKITRNLVIDWYRKKKAVSLEEIAESKEEDLEEVIPLEDNAKYLSEIEVEGRYLLKKIDELPKSYREPLYLKYVEGMNNEEISKILNTKESATAVRIHRGIEELKKITGYQNE